MFKALILAGLFTFSTLLAGGCNTVAPTVPATPTISSEQIEREQICSAVEEYAHLSARKLENTNELSKAGNIKIKYEIEACKKILFAPRAYGIITFHFYMGDNKLPFVEDEVMVALAPDNGKWTVVNAQLLYSSPNPEQVQEEDDDTLSVEEDNKNNDENQATEEAR